MTTRFLAVSLGDITVSPKRTDILDKFRHCCRVVITSSSVLSSFNDSQFPAIQVLMAQSTLSDLDITELIEASSFGENDKYS